MYTSIEFEQQPRNSHTAAAAARALPQAAMIAGAEIKPGNKRPGTSLRLHGRLALYNRVFEGLHGEEMEMEEVHIARATDELAAILQLLCEEQDLMQAPIVFSQGPGECGLVCEGHPQNERLQQCLEEIPGLAAAVLHLLHLTYNSQVMREYRSFQEHYRRCFAAQGRDAAKYLSMRYESLPCPAPQLVFDGRIMSVAFAGKPSCQRISELENLWQNAPARQHPRTVDRYFPGMFARHMPVG